MIERIRKIVLATVHQMGESDDKESLQNPTLDTKLFCKNGGLDSMGVIFLVTELEERIGEEFSINLTLADERAMSQRTSPFRTVASLVKYIDMLLKENQET